MNRVLYITLFGLFASALWLVARTNSHSSHEHQNLVALQWPADITSIYAFEYRTLASIAKASGGSEQNIDIDIEGFIRDHGPSSRADEGHLRVNWELARGRADIFGHTIPNSEFNAEVEVRATSEGELSHLRVPEGLEEPALGVLKSMLRLRSFKLKVDARPGDTWRHQGSDFEGDFVDEYKLLAYDAPIARIERRRKMTRPRGFLARSHKFEWEEVIQLDLARGRLESLDARISRSQVFAKDLTSRSRTSYTMKLVNEVAHPGRTLAASSPSLIPTALTVDALPKEQMRLLDEQALAGHTWDSLQALLKAPPQERGGATLIDPIRAMFRLHPESLEQAKDLVLAAESVEDPQFGILVAAMGVADTPRAQSVLHELLRSSELDPDKQVAVVQHLGLVQHPTTDTVKELLQLARAESEPAQLRSRAELALGTASGRVAAPAVEEQGLTHLETALRNAASAEARTHLANALGNAGMERFDPVLIEMSQSESLLERLGALRNLGKSPGLRAKHQLFDRAIASASHEEQQVSLDALRAHSLTEDEIHEVSNLALDHREPSIRLRALELISSYYDLFDFVRETIESSRRIDDDTRVRNFAELIQLTHQS